MRVGRYTTRNVTGRTKISLSSVTGRGIVGGQERRRLLPLPPPPLSPPLPTILKSLDGPYQKKPVAKFLVPELGDIVDSGIGLSYRPASLYWRAGVTTLCRSQLYPPSQELWMWPLVRTKAFVPPVIYSLDRPTGLQWVYCRLYIFIC